MDGDRVGLGDAGEEAGDEQHEGVDGGAGQEHEETEGEAGDADDRASTDPVGEPPHGAGAEHEERHRCGRDEGDRAVGDAEGLGDVGAEDVDRGLLEFVEGVEQQQHDEGEEAAFAESFLERHLVAADTGQEVVGKDDVGRSLGLTAWRAASSSSTAAVSDDALVESSMSLTRPQRCLQRPGPAGP